MTVFTGIPVVTSDLIPDGDYHLTPEVFVIGTGPVDWHTWCQREALRIVRTGLADVLEWLGEPAWKPPLTSAKFFEAVSRG